MAGLASMLSWDDKKELWKVCQVSLGWEWLAISNSSTTLQTVTVVCASRVVSSLLWCKNQLKVREFLHLILLFKASPHFLRLFYRHVSPGAGWGMLASCSHCALSSQSLSERVPGLQYKSWQILAGRTDTCLVTFQTHQLYCNVSPCSLLENLWKKLCSVLRVRLDSLLESTRALKLWLSK